MAAYIAPKPVSINGAYTEVQVTRGLCINVLL